MSTIKPIAASSTTATRASTVEGAPRGAKPALLVPEVRQKLLGDIDTLWAKGKYAEIVRHTADHVRSVAAASMKGLGINELIDVNEQLFILQQRLIAVSNKLSLVDEPVAARSALTLQERIGELRTHAFRAGVAMFDKSVQNPVGPWQVYKNTMKKPGFHSPDLQESYYLEKAREFIRRGGDFEQIKPVSAEFIASLKSGELAEWVVDAYDEARICKSDVPVAPNHTLLARGNDALSAGSFKLFRNEAGEITQVVVGTYSGHFRPSKESLQHMVRHLVVAGVPKEFITLEEGEAASARPVGELFYGLAGLAGAEAQTRMTQLLAEAERWSPQPQQVGDESGLPARAPLIGPERQSFDSAELNEALFALRRTTGAVMSDGLVLSALGEGAALVSVIERVLVLAEKAGNPLAYREAKAVLEHLAQLPPAHIDAAARRTVGTFAKRWEKHRFGSGAVDAADVLSARPAGRRARIVATIDPKNSTVASLKPLIAAGLDVPRLNIGHGTLEDHKRTIRYLRQAAAELGKPVSILVDLPGPKIRLGKFENPKNLEFNDIHLKAGDAVMLTTADVLGNNKLLPVDYPTLADDVKAGDPIYMNDGMVKLTAKKVYKDASGAGVVEAEVQNDGKVYDRKGINLPKSKLSIPTVPPEDVAALKELINDADIFGISFVRAAEDILFARQKMAEFGRVVPICAKIERPEGLDNLEAIAAAADMLMVARGDMGVELGDELVPEASRRINQVGNVLGKPTIVATEVLHSMVKSPRPTRGEVDGLYSAIHEQGADAIMLAKETSGGDYRVEAVRMAHAVIVQAEEALARAPYVAQKDELSTDAVNQVCDVLTAPAHWARRNMPELLDNAASLPGHLARR